MQPPAPIDFVVLTGFLGSGKTTLLAEYLRLQEAADTAVIVNEAGEIGLDGAILRETGGDVPMTMLSNGCVCCQMNSSLAVTIAALLAADRPQASGPLRRIILETSGLAKPGPILRSLAGLAEQDHAHDQQDEQSEHLVHAIFLQKAGDPIRKQQHRDA